jgi:hypothetical protein
MPAEKLENPCSVPWECMGITFVQAVGFNNELNINVMFCITINSNRIHIRTTAKTHAQFLQYDSKLQNED